MTGAIAATTVDVLANDALLDGATPTVLLQDGV